MEIGQRIRELREASPETNRSIADAVDVGERSVANWIAGDTGITYEHAKKVAAIFGVDHRWLWDGQERGDTPDVLGALSPDAGILAAIRELAQKVSLLQDGQTKLLAELALVRSAQEDQRKTQGRGGQKKANG